MASDPRYKLARLAEAHGILQRDHANALERTNSAEAAQRKLESAVEARFQWLTVPPGDSVREIDLWATYAMDAGDDYFADWDFYWPRLEAWLQD